jgi:hypothetical protein
MNKKFVLLGLLLLFVGSVIATELEIKPVMVKSLITINDEIKKIPIKVKNIGIEGENISSESSKEYFKLNDNNFFLVPNQTRGLYFNFKPEVIGVYSGSIRIYTDEREYTVPVIIEVESKNVFFDSKVEVKNNIINKGEELQIGLDIFNLREIVDDDVEVSYYIKEIDGDTILEDSEIINVKSHEYYLKSIELPNDIKEGDYFIMVKTRKGVYVGTSTDIFQIVVPKKEEIVPTVFESCIANKICLISLSVGSVIISLLIIVYLIDIFIISRMPKKKLKRVYRKPRKRKKKDSLIKKIEREFGLLKTKEEREREEEVKRKKVIEKILKDKQKSF